MRVCKIRFVNTGENHGKPYLVCKKEYSAIIITVFMHFLALEIDQDLGEKSLNLTCSQW